MKKKKKRPLRISTVLNNIYHNPKHPYSFSSPYLLYKAAKKVNKNITLEAVEDWLSGEKSYTLHRTVVTHFPRRKVLVPGVQHQYQADLVDYAPLKKENDNIRYLLTIMDCFSRFALALPLKTKTGIEVAPTLEKAFTVMGTPHKLQTDNGGEFYNKHVKEFLKNSNVEHFSTDQELKAQLVERFNRTLREKIQKFMVSQNTLRYIDVLPDLLLSYNSKIHGSLKEFAPNEVNKSNEKKVHDLQYGDYLAEKRRNHKFEINDAVRIASYRKLFMKSYHKTFTDEIFYIADKLFTNPPTYRLRDSADEILIGSFYESQLQKVKV